jgi:hypothetical protein
MKIIKSGDKKYIIDNKKDLEIWNKIKKLEKKKLIMQELETIKLIKTQLQEDWRTPLIKYLNKLSKKI